MLIVDMSDAHVAAFKALNEAWISLHFALESEDRKALDDPWTKIVRPGGAVLVAVDDVGAVIGTAALIPMPDGGFELAKMTTAEAARGRGVARALMTAAVERARALGAARLYLETNSALAPAIALYEATGFVHLPAQTTPYARADVFMELRLQAR